MAGRVLAALVVLGTVFAGCSQSGGGVLRANTGGDFTEGLVAAVGAPLTAAPGVMLINPTHHPVTIEDVRVLRIDPALRFQGWRLDRAVSDGRTSVLMANSTPFPPTDVGVQKGSVVGPTTTRNSDGQLVGDVTVAIGLTLLKAGSYQASGIEVTYRSGSGTRHATLCTACRFELHTP